jgi:ADP-ribose pyrophosphatase YjhB (NUDIX family)
MDISFKTDLGKFNYRITAAIYNKKNGKFLLQKGNAFDFWVLPGGRCQIGELSEEAIKRELQEEIGCFNISSIKSVAVSENLFKFDIPYHELSYCYAIELDSDCELLSKEGAFYGIESKDYIFEWKSIDEIKKIDFKPSFYLDVLDCISKGDFSLKHYTFNEL